MMMTKHTISILLSLLLFLAVTGLPSVSDGLNRSSILAGTPEMDADNDATSETNETEGDNIGERYKLVYKGRDEIDEITSQRIPRRLGARVQTFFLGTLLRIRESVWTWRERNQMTAQERAIVNVYRKTAPAVVELKIYHSINITDAILEGKGIHLEDLGEGMAVGSVSSVSAFLWDDQGHIVTNHHCLYGTDRVEILRIRVRFPGITEFLNAEVIGFDASHDLAVVKISSEQFNPAFSNPLRFLPKPIPKGSSRFLQVGQTCLAIGAPEGRSDILTVGVISALDQIIPRVDTDGVQLDGIGGCIRADAHVGPGSSGGPLLDTQGRLIGIIFGREENNSRRGFSIAVDIAKRVVGQLIQKGYTETAITGIVFSSDSLQTELELEKGSRFGGVLIMSVPINSPADDAGLKGSVILKESDDSVLLEARDLIVGVDGKQVTSGEEFLGILDSKLPGQVALITVSRAASIGELKRWNEVIPIKLTTFAELCEKCEEVRIMQEDQEEA